MEIVIRKPGKDLIKFLLDKAVEEGLPASVVRLTPDGLFLPLELADSAGLLDEIKNVPEVESERESEPERVQPKRVSRKRAAAKHVEEVSEETPVEDAEDPWS